MFGLLTNIYKAVKLNICAHFLGGGDSVARLRLCDVYKVIWKQGIPP